MNSRQLICDDWYDVAAIGLCKAAIAYNPQGEKFSFLAVDYINNEINLEFQQINESVPEVSLEDYYNSSGNILIAPNRADDLLNYNELLKFINNNMNERQKKIIFLLLEKMTQQEIAENLSIPIKVVSKEIEYIKKTIGKYYDE